MPKTNGGGATYYGVEGYVEDAHGKVSQLDPSRNADGTVVEGFQSEDRQMSDYNAPDGGDYEAPAPDPTQMRPAGDESTEGTPDDKPVDEESTDDKSVDQAKEDAPSRTSARAPRTSAKK